MKLSEDTKILDLFNEFCGQFPYLKLEFYTLSHSENEGSSMKELVSHDILLGDLNPGINETDYQIDKNMSVADFEKEMCDRFKLNIQVFRKSKDIWLQTTSTDHWTIEKQNGKGERSTDDYESSPVSISDFDVE